MMWFFELLFLLTKQDTENQVSFACIKIMRCLQDSCCCKYFSSWTSPSVWLYHNNLCLDKAWWQTLVVANQFIGSNCKIKLLRIKIGFKYYWWNMNYTYVLTELHGWKLPLVRWLHTLCACVLPAAVHVFCALSGQEPADEKIKITIVVMYSNDIFKS